MSQEAVAMELVQADSAPKEGEPEKKKRGKPKDPHAPPKPKNAYQQVTGAARGRLKEERPELASDLAGMAAAMKEEWDKVSEAEKEKIQAQYEKDMEVWRPKWAAYKLTPHYKSFFEEKQDWVDGRQTKKLKKKAAKEAPKRPRSGYMIFAGEIRERVQAEVTAAGGGMGDVGTKISAEWAAVSEAKKAEYGEQSARQKEVFDVEYAKYKKTAAFATFCDEKAQLEAKQQLKKLTRTKLDEKPEKAPSAFALYRREATPLIKEALGGKVQMSEFGKKAAEMWAAVPDTKKAEYEAQSAQLKSEYEKKMLEFKRNTKYASFLEERFKVKNKENKLLNLRELPKRPASVFAMFAAEHKAEVPQGKGEGKGRDALKTKFQGASEEEKQKLAEKEKELKGKWEEEVKTYKSSDKFLGFQRNTQKIKTEFMTEAMKVLTLKFLTDAPAAPPKSGFSVFVGEKRKASQEAGGERKDKKQKLADLDQWRKDYAKLAKEIKVAYDAQQKEKVSEWTAQVKEYMARDTWQEYVKECKTLKIPVKSMLNQKKQVQKKLANGMIAVPLPTRPESYPGKPPNAFKIFMVEQKNNGIADLAEINSLWEKLDEAGKKDYADKEKERQAQYEKDMEDFRSNAEGKKYFIELRSAIRRKRIGEAKAKYLKDMPKAPPSVVAIYFKKNAGPLRKQHPEAKGFEIKKMLTDRWQAMDASDRLILEDEGKARVKDFEEKLQEFKKTEDWNKFQKAVKAKGKAAKGKGKAKAAGPMAPAKPAGAPARPMDAIKQFMKEQTGGGKGLGELAKMFRELPEEDRAERIKQGLERQEKYKAELAEFGKTAEGKKYKKELELYQRKKYLGLAKDKYLGKADAPKEPKKPMGAYFLFVNAKRSDVARDFPDLKGLGPVQKKLAELWTGLSAEDREIWTGKEKEAKAAYEKELAEYQATPEYKRYKMAFNRITGANAMQAKMRMKEKENSKKKSKTLEMPSEPTNLPKKPPGAFMLFLQEQRAANPGANQQKFTDDWRNLGAEGQQKYTDDATAKMNQYEKDMKEFQKSVEGKKYLRLKAGVEIKNKLILAKERFLGSSEAPQEPKRPASSYFIFVSEKRPSLKPGTGLAEAAKQLTDMWKACTPEETKVYNEKASELKKEYEEKMVAYRNSAEYKKYEKARKVVETSGKPKPKPKAAIVARPAAAASSAVAGRGKGAGKRAPAGKDDSDDDVMGSDSNSSSSSSDSD